MSLKGVVLGGNPTGQKCISCLVYDEQKRVAA